MANAVGIDFTERILSVLGERMAGGNAILSIRTILAEGMPVD